MAAGKSDRLIVMGVILGAHGVRGDVRVKSFTEDPEALFDFATLLDGDGKPLLEPVSARAAKDHFIVRPRSPRQKEEWDALRGRELHVHRDALPDEDEDEFYIEDLVGLTAVSEAGAKIGRVKAVHDFGAGDLLEIEPAGSKPVMVPFTLADIPDVDLAAGKVIVATFEAWADTSDEA